MKNILCLLLFICLATACRTTGEPHLQTANRHSNAKTKAILTYFQSLESRTDKRLVSGQFSSFGGGANLRIMTNIFNQTGHWPAMLGVDYADFRNRGITFNVPNKSSIEYWKQGGLVHISAHLYNPANTNRLNTRDGGLRDKGVDLNALLTPGSETYTRWMHEMDELAAGLQELRDAGVVVLWRPFHEMNGDWFWWCNHDPEQFHKLWRQMFDYFTNAKGLDNLLWVYGPNHGRNTVAYYPGDDYVDLIGLDAYTDFIDPEHIKGYDEISQIKKPFGFTEYGPHAASNPPGNYDYRRFLDGVQRNFPRTVFFMSWNAKWSLASNTNVTEFLSDPRVVNREDLPEGLVKSQ